MPITTPPQINTNVLAKIDGNVVQAKYVGLYPEGSENARAVVEYNGRKFLRTFSRLNHLGEVLTNTPEPVSGIVSIEKPAYAQPSVKERVEFTELLCDSVVEGNADSMIICGSPGMGKSRLVIDRLNYHDLGTYDTMTHRGFSTPKGLYEILYRNMHKLIVFDDCDSIFSNETSANILKAALDTYETRIVSWGSSRETHDLPNEFEFKGRVICITNHKLVDVPEAFTSRSVYTDLTMTPEEKIERIHQIGDKLCPKLNATQVQECISLLDEHKDMMTNLNLRTMQMVGKLRLAQPSQWNRIAKYMILAK